MAISTLYEIEREYPTLLDCIKIMKSRSVKIIFFVQDNSLFGCLSQGDVLDAVVQNQNLNSSASKFINRSPLVVRSVDEVKQDKVSQFFLNGGLCVPELDINNAVIELHEYVDLISEGK